MKISNNFRLSEFTRTSSKAANNPTEVERSAIIELVRSVIQPARDELALPITITSGFRSTAVNSAVGGAKTSQHLKGEAADMKCANNALLFRIIKDNLVFDQLIWEYGDNNQPAWVHVSYKLQGNRNECLKAVKVGGKTQYIRL